MSQDNLDVRRQAGVIEGRRPCIGTAAIAHVHADHIAAGSPGQLSDPENITGIGGALEPVYEEQCQALRAFRLPVTMTEDSAAIGLIHEDGFGFMGKSEGGTAPVVAEERLLMAAREERPISSEP